MKGTYLLGKTGHRHALIDDDDLPPFQWVYKRLDSYEVYFVL